MSRTSVGVIGLGLMGIEIAQRLNTANIPVLGSDINRQRCQLAADTGIQVTSSPNEIWTTCQEIILSLPNDSIASAVIQSAALRPGHVIIDTTTGSPESTEVVVKGLPIGVELVDATISGSSAQLRSGTAVIIAGATAHGWQQVQPTLAALSKTCFHVGPPGAGARMKLVTNLVLGLNRAALAEGLAYARAQGLDLKLTLELLKATPAYSRMMDTKGDKMIQRDFTPQAKLSQHLKDVNLIIQCAQQNELTLPLSQAHRQILQAAEERGFGELDNSALITAYDPKHVDASNSELGHNQNVRVLITPSMTEPSNGPEFPDR